MIRIEDIPVCGSPIDEKALAQIQRCRGVLEGAAMMADHHMGYSAPIGGVGWSQELIAPAFVGYDIACGNKAARLDADPLWVKQNISTIMDKLASQISFGIGRVSGWDVQAPLFDSPLWKELPALDTRDRQGKELIQLAKEQLGTVGSGNHYVDIFEDEKGRIWVGVHFGSRGLGHKIATWFLEAAQASDNMDAVPVTLHQFSDLGEQYIKAMNLAGEYAYAGRDAVVAKVAEILGANILEEVHNHHNFAWRENIGGIDYWVMRKGATPAFPGQKGFVGGSMGDNAVIIEGVRGKESEELFYSTVHGAGRVMSRTQATGKSKWGKKKGEGLISKDAMMNWVKDFGVELRGADTDEAPQAYKRLAEVLPEQGKTIRVLHTLRPLGVVMAGSDIVDPYKD